MLELRPLQIQTQQLKMTTELRQAIHLLQYSTQELSDYIREQAMENPLMALEEPSVPPTPSASFSSTSSNSSEQRDPLSFIKQEEDSLQEDLLQQLRYLPLDQQQRRLTSHLVLYIEEDGYLREDLEMIAEECGVTEQAIHEALQIVQTLEPAGIGARHLRECLMLQIQRKASEKALAYTLVRDHLEAIASSNHHEIAEILAVEVKDIESAIQLIQTLNPRPGEMLSREQPIYIQPDVVVHSSDGQYTVRLESDLLPAIHYDRSYHALLKSANDHEATRYLQGKYKQMLWLLRSIEQRHHTLLNVSQAIMHHQKQFLDKGIYYLAPLTLRDIAQTCGIHESTVSRAVKNKYIQTPQGLFELKTFFSTKIRTYYHQEVSATSVKALIRALIEAEDKAKPLSDQAIVDHLQTSRGLVLSRRTVAKYRKAMHLPSSSKRKSQGAHY
ncbi:RNA polymerase sigma-54 factor [Pullulanibacillus camelliae]|uniref:RNA polymerase sigma-54 factor n=1 Tax=Pullulanibacillus camelliae TaxID=1707096 RepID=A0A8J2YK29_9BACL|nr:RNA polymerase factor sigma-54 [Pullulanibacillus camelliae]GGE50023.1 RNA polymerase sigma-54 factor [Pullulanibacillus camelliae]